MVVDSCISAAEALVGVEVARGKLVEEESPRPTPGHVPQNRLIG